MHVTLSVANRTDLDFKALIFQAASNSRVAEMSHKSVELTAGNKVIRRVFERVTMSPINFRPKARRKSDPSTLDITIGEDDDVEDRELKRSS